MQLIGHSDRVQTIGVGTTLGRVGRLTNPRRTARCTDLTGQLRKGVLPYGRRRRPMGSRIRQMTNTPSPHLR